jgi:hypothetical protein
MGAPGNERLLDEGLREGLTAAYAYLEKHPEPKLKGDAGFYEALRALRTEKGLAPFDTALRVAGCKVTKTLDKEVGGLLVAARASAATSTGEQSRPTCKAVHV